MKAATLFCANVTCHHITHHIKVYKLFICKVQLETFDLTLSIIKFECVVLRASADKMSDVSVIGEFIGQFSQKTDFLFR